MLRDSQRFPVLRGLWNFYNVRADYQTSTELSEKLMYIAQHLKDKPYLLGAHRTLGSDLF